MISVVSSLVSPANFRTVFFNIKKKTDDMLSAYNNVDFLENPAIDIEAIARKNGIIDIKRVPKESIPEKHATLENGIIKVNQEDRPEDQNFSIGHEVEHHIKQKADALKKANERKQITFKKAEIKNILDKQGVEQANSVFEAAARSNYERVIQELKKISYFTEIAKPIASIASKNFGKHIPEEKALNSIAKLICTGNDKVDNEFIIKAADDLYNEEIADYFAANLLVPIERFMLWEDKQDEEIAAAFKVPVGCIIKRREEIELELKYLAE
jgi:Zn-dependent peptidase ImmA (M78 family)